MTVEPNKPRLCVDARFLNLWMKDTPFSLETLVLVPRTAYRNCHFSKIDDKYRYDHILISADSQQFFGVEWMGWYLVSATLPFGWKNSPFVYQTVGLGPTHYFKSLGITDSLYIDDRLVGEIFALEGLWSRPLELRGPEYSRRAALAALYAACKVLVNLGYFLGLSKCVLAPSTRLTFLGMVIDTRLLAFVVPEEKRVKFAELRESILSKPSTIPLKSIQKLMGKCISFSLAFPGAKFYIREMGAAVGQASRGADVTLPPPLREEMEFWRFLDGWQDAIPWIQESHISVSLSTDASAFRWAAVFHQKPADRNVGDYWEDNLMNEHINVKEMHAVLKALESLPTSVKDCRVDLQVDNQATLNAWHGRGPRSSKLNQVAPQIFHVVTSKNLALSISYVPSGLNPADFSRRLSDSDAMLSPRCWDIVQSIFGGLNGHTLDLMALDSNAQHHRAGNRLPHFTPFPTPYSAGVNVFNQDLSPCDGIIINAYAFPPFSLIGPLLRFMRSQCTTVTLVLPEPSPLPFWWLVINSMAKRRALVAPKGCADAVLFPSRPGFRPKRINFSLWAFRVGEQ